jgi:hypothetical protein
MIVKEGRGFVKVKFAGWERKTVEKPWPPFHGAALIDLGRNLR